MPTEVDILLVPKISDSTQLVGKSLTISDDTDGTPYRFSGDTIKGEIDRLSDTSGTNTGDQTASDFDIKDLTDSSSLRATWSGKQNALGFAPENVANKKQTVTNSETDYPNGKAVYDGLALKIDKTAIKQILGSSTTDIMSQKAITDEFIASGLNWYGISWDDTIATTAMTRTGNPQFHRQLPIQSKMRGCLVSDTGVVTYLPANWADGVLDGSAGQVMVEIPEHYRLFIDNGTVHECRISEYPLPSYTRIAKCYISAYEATVARSTSKLSSVVNTTAEYRGGNNNSAYDEASNTFLGKPATVLTRAQFRTYARNRGAGWEMLDYKTYNTLFWLYFVEYANMNSQLAVNSALDGSGYRQGGLGNGVTDIAYADWNTFNGCYPIVNCGASNSLGNGSGEVSYTVPFTIPVTTKVNRYRGIENLFGHIWKNCDGIIFDVKTDADGGTSNIYICSVPSNYSDSVTGNYTLIGQIPRMEGFVKILQTGSFLPLTIGAGSTTYWCDYFYQSIASSSLRTLILGGNANNGSLAGLGYSNSYVSVAIAGADIGARLCFFPQ